METAITAQEASNLITIAMFDRMLAAHDWFYRESDDLHVYQRGQKEHQRLKAISKDDQAKAELYAAYCASNGVNVEARMSRKALDDVRVMCGAITREELDRIEFEKSQRLHRQEQERQRQLYEFVGLLKAHDWYYWHRQTHVSEYVTGYAQRRKMRDMTTYGEWAWAKRDLWKAYTSENFAGKSGEFKSVCEKFGLSV